VEGIECDKGSRRPPLVIHCDRLFSHRVRPMMANSNLTPGRTTFAIVGGCIITKSPSPILRLLSYHGDGERGVQWSVRQL
jgi:hypothetical protein